MDHQKLLKNSVNNIKSINLEEIYNIPKEKSNGLLNRKPMQKKNSDLRNQPTVMVAQAIDIFRKKIRGV